MQRRNRHITLELMGLTNQLRRNADAITALHGGQKFTGMHSFILTFLFRQLEAGREVYQRDVEKEFYISRSTASGILSLMEKNGLIDRLSVPQDARLKKLVPTPKAWQIMSLIRNDLETMDTRIESALTPEELAQMHLLLGKLWQGVEEVSASLGLEPVRR